MLKVKISSIVIIIMAFGFCSPKVSQLAVKDVDSNDEYKLVWADEFNKDGRPDTANWSYEQGFVRNEELQWYQPENARCENGLLIIEAKKEEKPNPRYEAGSNDWRRKRPSIHYTLACCAIIVTLIKLESKKYNGFI